VSSRLSVTGAFARTERVLGAKRIWSVPSTGALYALAVG
jgi:hypothetical protein